MLAAFQVGQKEVHYIEVEQPFFRSGMTVRVNNKTIVERQKSKLRITTTVRIPFSVGVDEIHNVEIRINY